MRHPQCEGKKGKEYLCIERKVAHSVMKARLQHSFDGHRARDTSIFLHIFSLQHFNFLLLSDPMFPFSIFISLFSNRSSSRNYGKSEIIAGSPRFSALRTSRTKRSDNCRNSVYFQKILESFKNNFRYNCKTWQNKRVGRQTGRKMTPLPVES